MSKLLDIVDAVDGCEKHQCQTVKTSICENCSSHYGTYTNLEGKVGIVCIYPDEMPSK